MAKKRIDARQGGFLFEPPDSDRKSPTDCTHPKKSLEGTETVWPGETCRRMTMTCRDCGWYRGRYPRE
jgi:hypothetical protein